MSSTVVELSSGSAGHGNNAVNTVPNTNTNNNGNNNEQHSGVSNAVLQRMRDTELKVQELMSTIENLQSDNKQKEAVIQHLENEREELSTERRMDMEKMINNAINDWLNSLKVSEEVRKQFKQGIDGMAKKADIKNHAWEVVCNASQAHKENVAKIEELVRICDEKEKTIETLLQNNHDTQFRTPASRMSSSAGATTVLSSNVAGSDGNNNSGYKRLRGSDEPLYNTHGSTLSNDSSSSSNTKRNTGLESNKNNDKDDAWDYFANLIRDQSRNTYF